MGGGPGYVWSTSLRGLRIESYRNVAITVLGAVWPEHTRVEGTLGGSERFVTVLTKAASRVLFVLGFFVRFVWKFAVVWTFFGGGLRCHPKITRAGVS